MQKVYHKKIEDVQTYHLALFMSWNIFLTNTLSWVFTIQEDLCLTIPMATERLQIIRQGGEVNQIPQGTHVKTEIGQPATLTTDTNPDDIQTLITQRTRPSVVSVNSHPTEREIRAAIAEIASANHGAITKQHQQDMAERLRDGK